MRGNILFITGIDTNIGKTYATGLLAKALTDAGYKVITQKMVQTGCVDVSEDIEMHRQLQGIDLLTEDKAGLTCPYIFSYPCSPHMAAARDGRHFDLKRITSATDLLRSDYDYILIEGAGGLMVPCDMQTLTIDYIKEQGYPVVLVTSGRLGSINHTLLCLFACKSYGIPVRSIIYNLYPPTDKQIEANTLDYLNRYLAKEFPGTSLILLPDMTNGTTSIHLTGLI